MTVRECLDRARARIEAAGFAPADAALDARVLVSHVLRRDTAWLLAHDDHVPSAPEVSQIDHCVARRTTHEPVAYITGVREFYGRPFSVSPAVLIPRPETELIIEAFLEAFPPADTGAIVEVADVGTGSGCIAITIACEHPGARVTAIDISPAALSIARENAVRLGVADRVTFVQASLIPPHFWNFDAIVTNPPYVSMHDHAYLSPTVREFEPHVALFAGPTGLDVITPLLTRAAAALKPGGLLAMELGAGQASTVRWLAAEAGFTQCDVRLDLAGIERTLVARR